VIKKDDYKKCTRYLKGRWRDLTARTVKDKKLLIGLPYAYVCPSRDEFDEKMYYWDSYFIILGPVACRLFPALDRRRGQGAGAASGNEP
jgi:neutral trehalase